MYPIIVQKLQGTVFFCIFKGKKILVTAWSLASADVQNNGPSFFLSCAKQEK